jgi:hypothetical protein
MMKFFVFLMVPMVVLCGFGLAEESGWRNADSVHSFQFNTPLMNGRFVANDARDLGKGYGRHGIRGLTFQGHDLHAPASEVGGKRRHQGILNLYRVYSATETFGALRDDQAEVEELEDGARLTWAASEKRPVKIIATWRVTGLAVIDVSIKAIPIRKMANFEILPATYVAVGMVKGLYTGSAENRQMTMRHSPAGTEGDLTYAFFPLGESARASQENTGRLHSEWKWPTTVADETAALPILIAQAENDSFQILQFADPSTTSAVCVTPTPESGAPETWNQVEQHSAMYFSLFGCDVEANETLETHLRMVVKELPEKPGPDFDMEQLHLDLYGEFLESLKRS